MEILKKTVAASAVAALVAGLGVVAIATPSSAGSAGDCLVRTYTPVLINGSSVRAKSYMSCPNPGSLHPIRVDTVVVEQWGSIWWNRGGVTKGTTTGYSITVPYDYYCVGHGTDNYKSNTYGENSLHIWWAGESAAASITC